MRKRITEIDPEEIGYTSSPGNGRKFIVARSNLPVEVVETVRRAICTVAKRSLDPDTEKAVATLATALGTDEGEYTEYSSSEEMQTELQGVLSQVPEEWRDSIGVISRAMHDEDMDEMDEEEDKKKKKRIVGIGDLYYFLRQKVLELVDSEQDNEASAHARCANKLLTCAAIYVLFDEGLDPDSLFPTGDAVRASDLFGADFEMVNKCVQDSDLPAPSMGWWSKPNDAVMRAATLEQRLAVVESRSKVELAVEPKVDELQDLSALTRSMQQVLDSDIDRTSKAEALQRLMNSLGEHLQQGLSSVVSRSVEDELELVRSAIRDEVAPLTEKLKLLEEKITGSDDSTETTGIRRVSLVPAPSLRSKPKSLSARELALQSTRITSDIY